MNDCMLSYEKGQTDMLLRCIDRNESLPRPKDPLLRIPADEERHDIVFMLRGMLSALTSGKNVPE